MKTTNTLIAITAALALQTTTALAAVFTTDTSIGAGSKFYQVKADN